MKLKPINIKPITEHQQETFSAWKSGDNLVLKVPLGTQIFEEDNNTLIYDLTKNRENHQKIDS